MLTLALLLDKDRLSNIYAEIDETDGSFLEIVKNNKTDFDAFMDKIKEKVEAARQNKQDVHSY